MKLSAAIRKGAGLRPQIYGNYYGWIEDEQNYGTCALGAAYEAITGELASGNHKVMEFLEQTTNTPRDILCMVVDENDDQHASRERIADWLEKEGY